MMMIITIYCIKQAAQANVKAQSEWEEEVGCLLFEINNEKFFTFSKYCLTASQSDCCSISQFMAVSLFVLSVPP